MAREAADRKNYFETQAICQEAVAEPRAAQNHKNATAAFPDSDTFDQNFKTPSTCSRVMPLAEPAGLGWIRSVMKQVTPSVKES